MIKQIALATTAALATCAAHAVELRSADVHNADDYPTVAAVKPTILIGTSTMFQYLMGLYSVADMAGEFMRGISDNPLVIFLLINLILFVLGTFMDLAPMLLICTPVFLPVIQKFGIDPVHFGIIMIFNLGIGLLTPPVGPTLAVGCAIGKVTMEAVSRSIMLFYIPMLIVLMLITYVPALTLWLPRLLLGN